MSKMQVHHKWTRSDNQADTGMMGVRLECSCHYPGMKPHYLTVHQDLLGKYL